MNEEFTNFCSQLYFLFERLKKESAYLEKFIDNAPLYKGETQLSEIDYIINYYRKTQAVKAARDKTLDEMKETEKNILAIMRHFDIPPRTYLQGVVEDEFEFEVWTDCNDEVYIRKIKDLAPPYNPNYIISEMDDDSIGIFDDEHEWFPEVGSLQ